MAAGECGVTRRVAFDVMKYWFPILLLAPRLWAVHGIFQSADGKNLEGDIQLEAGGFVIASTNGAMNTFKLEELSLLRFQPPAPDIPPVEPPVPASPAPTNGLLGLYYNEPDLTGEFRMRHDATIDFDWEEGSPLTGIRPNGFSVRWIGQLAPLVTDFYVFYTVTDDGVRLWVDDKLVIESWREGVQNFSTRPIALNAGTKYELRMEMFDIRERAAARLSWSSSSSPQSVIPAAQLVPGTPPSREPTRDKSPPGVLLANGTFLARRVHAADQTSVKFSASLKEPALSTVNVARIIFQPLAPELAVRLQPGRAGLLLANRDFAEGEFKGFADGKIKLSSVLFGVKSYDADKVVAVILRDPKPAAARYALRTRDQSLLLITALRVEKDGVTVLDAALPGFKIPTGELVEIQRQR